MIRTTKELLKFWEEQMKQSHRSSNYFLESHLRIIIWC